MCLAASQILYSFAMLPDTLPPHSRGIVTALRLHLHSYPAATHTPSRCPAGWHAPRRALQSRAAPTAAAPPPAARRRRAPALGSGGGSGISAMRSRTHGCRRGARTADAVRQQRHAAVDALHLESQLGRAHLRRHLTHCGPGGRVQATQHLQLAALDINLCQAEEQRLVSAVGAHNSQREGRDGTGAKQAGAGLSLSPTSIPRAPRESSPAG